MKLFFYTITLFATCFVSQAQTTILFSEFFDPTRFLQVEDDIYFTTRYSLEKFDSTLETPVSETVMGMDNPAGIALLGDEMFYTKFYQPELYKINITDAVPTPVAVANVGLYANQLELIGDILYISNGVDNNIIRVDVSQPPYTSPVNTVISGLNSPIGLESRDNELYIAEADKIIKIDVTDENPTPVTVLENLSRPLGLELFNDDLYIADKDADRVIKIDITDANPVAETVVELYAANDMVIVNNFMYIIEGGSSDNVHKLDEEIIVLGTPEVNQTIATLYPNPAENTLQLSGLIEKTTYTIYNVLGVAVKSGTIELNDTIAINELSSGMYILNLDKATSIKFVKK